MQPVETYEHQGVTVEIHYDEDAGEFCNPRNNDGNLTTMVCWHPDYILGDEQLRGERGAVETVFESEHGRTDVSSMRHLYRYLTLMRGAVCVLPLYLYDHSGISISAGTGNPFDNPTVRRDEFGRGMGWDTSMVGFVYTTRERLVENCGEENRPTILRSCSGRCSRKSPSTTRSCAARSTASLWTRTDPTKIHAGDSSETSTTARKQRTSLPSTLRLSGPSGRGSAGVACIVARSLPLAVRHRDRRRLHSLTHRPVGTEHAYRRRGCARNSHDTPRGRRDTRRRAARARHSQPRVFPLRDTGSQLERPAGIRVTTATGLARTTESIALARTGTAARGGTQCNR